MVNENVFPLSSERYRLYKQYTKADGEIRRTWLFLALYAGIVLGYIGASLMFSYLIDNKTVEPAYTVETRPSGQFIPTATQRPTPPIPKTNSI